MAANKPEEIFISKFIDDTKKAGATKETVNFLIALLYPNVADNLAKHGNRQMETAISEASFYKKNVERLSVPGINEKEYFGPGFYTLLRVPRYATKQQIQAGFRKLAREFHPDVSQNSEEIFQHINAAYEVLSDDQKRAEYDRSLQEWERLTPKVEEEFEVARQPEYTASSQPQAWRSETPPVYEPPTTQPMPQAEVEMLPGGIGEQVGGRLRGAVEGKAKEGLKAAGEKAGILKKTGEETKALKEGAEAAKVAATAGKGILAGAKAIATGGLTLLTDTLFGYAQRHKEVYPLALSIGAMAAGLLIGGPLGGILFGVGALGTIGLGVATLGGGAVGAAAAGAGTGLAHVLTTATVAVAAGIGMPLIIIFVIILVALPLILFIINTGAYVVPPYYNTNLPVGTVQSDYITVTKEANRTPPNYSNDEVNQGIDVTYTVTVTATRGTLTNVSFTNICQIRNRGGTTSCTHPVPVPPAGDPTITIDPAVPFVFTYSQNYRGNSYFDSFIIDTFTVSATVEVSPGNPRTEQAAASLAIRIGTPPEDCPNGWPITGGSFYITQGAYTTSSHRITRPFNDPESIDIGSPIGRTVIATHSGIVRQGYNDGGYGRFVDIGSTCALGNGQVVAFISRYAHMSAAIVNTNENVNAGQPIGYSGNSGNSGGPHLHYEFRLGAPLTSGTPAGPYPDNPPYMWTNYIPVGLDRLRGCVGRTDCDLDFTN